MSDPKILTLPRWTCLRCGHEWRPRKETRPRICPKCKSPYWDRKRERAKQKRRRR